LLALLTFCGAILAAGLTRRRSTLAARDPMIAVAALGMFSAWLGATSVDWLYDIPGLAGMAIVAAAMLVVREKAAGPQAGGQVLGSQSPNGPVAGEPDRDGYHRARGTQAAMVTCLGILALLAASIGRQYAAVRYASDGATKLTAAPANAISSLETAESLDPYSLSTLYSIASAYAKLDDYPAARAALLKAQRLEPDNYVPPALLGDLAYRRGDLTVARGAYERALALDPREPALTNAIAQTTAALR
jgi:tetratricopeptide (TPR) repeat protein